MTRAEEYFGKSYVQAAFKNHGAWQVDELFAGSSAAHYVCNMVSSASQGSFKVVPGIMVEKNPQAVKVLQNNYEDRCCFTDINDLRSALGKSGVREEWGQPPVL